MQNMSAHDAKARFGALLDAVRNGPVFITKHGQEVAVVISKEEFDAMNAVKLESLRAAVQKGFESLQRGEYTDFSNTELAELGRKIKAKGRKRATRK